METENTQEKKVTLVLGGMGKTGRRVAERLKARGMLTRVGSRSGEPPFDWEDAATWAPALEGAESAYVSYYPDLAIPGAPAAVRAFAELAVQSGTRKLVLLSGRGEEEAQSAEQALMEVADEAGIEWTIVRCAWFMQNFDENYLLEPILAGEVALSSGHVPEPFVDAGDIADVAVAALTEDGHAGEVYELTGPRLLTMEEAVGEISKATRQEIRFVPVTLEEYESVLAKGDVPPEFLPFLTYLFGTVLDGRNTYLTDGVRRALGREPKDFSDYAREAAATGVWSKAAWGPQDLADDEQLSLRAEPSRGPRLRDDGRGLLRLLRLRDEGPRPTPGGAGCRRHAGHQHGGGYFCLYGGALRNRGGLWSLGSVGALCVGRTLCPVPHRRWRAVPHRNHPADDRLPRAAKRSAGESRAAQRREPLEALPLGLDRVEPPAGRHGPRCGGHAHDRAPCLEE
ncbi:MAG TPA: hypothetical protein VKA82_02720 [Rubrobacter sp.]|nr:hypothetical protein [Rubrobacter sp.]